MKRLLNWLRKPAVMALLGVLLLALIIWFEGPLLAFNGRELLAPARVRWSLILLLLLLWSGYFLYVWLAARMANARLMAGVAPPQPSAEEKAAQAEVALLAGRMQKAMDVLRSSGKQRKGQWLYQLPWYLFVGAPGAGKTTALVQSGLRFPLAEQLGKGALGGVGGTRHCDWWFTDEAVLLDTAGRYTTQDSHAEVDQGAWLGFLQLLRKQRRRRPINGVIVAISVPDLLQQSEAARQQQGQAIRARLQELREQLGIRFPVYVLITKCDLLAGFSEFFCQLSKEQRAQVWGMTFPLLDAPDASAALAAFPAEFGALEQRLQSQLSARLIRERDLQQRALVYGFPQQFGALGEVLHAMLNEIFQGNRYEESNLLRGVYFTSGTQEGSPIDRVMGAMAAAYGLPRQALSASGDGRSYFLTTLLRDVIFAEAEVAGVNVRLERQRRRLQWGALAGLAVLLVLGMTLLLNSYARNASLIELVDAQAAPVEAQAGQLRAEGSELDVLPLLDRIRTLPTGYEQRDDGAPLLMRFGLYQGEKLGDGTQSLYQRALRSTLLPRIVRRMEQQLRSSGGNLDYLYETLRDYLMLADGRHYDAASVARWAEFEWQRNLPGATPAQREALLRHAQALLAEYRNAPHHVALNQQLVADTRLALARMPVAERLYASVRRAMLKAGLPEFSVAAAGGRDALLVFARRSGDPLTRGVSGLYTRAGYARFRELSAEAATDSGRDSWVLAREEAAGGAEVQQDLQRLYFRDYIAAWDHLLDDLRIVPFASLDQGATITAALAGSESPLRKLLQQAAQETRFGQEEKATKQVLAKLTDSGAAALRRLQSAVSGDEAPAAAAAPVLHPVDAHFAELHRLVDGAGGSAAPLDAVLLQMKEVAAYFDAAAAARRAGAPAPAPDALLRLKRESASRSAQLAQMLKDIDSGGAALANGGERERISSMWSGEAGQFCRRAIAGRYPLVREASQEVTRDDFARFFGPGGMMDKFFNDNLRPYVEMREGAWRWRANVDRVALNLPPQVLESFQRAAQVREAFFSSGSGPAMHFELKLLSADPGLNQVLLEIDGQPVPFGPVASVRPASIQLPGARGGGLVRLETVPAGGRSLRAEGPWAWLRMMDQGALEPTAQGERYRLQFELDGRKLVYALTASSVINPFNRDMLERFRCPERL